MPHPAAIPPFPTHAPISDTSLDAVRHWQALLDARLIGTRPETPPNVAANRAATDALFRSIAHDRRRLERAASFTLPPPCIDPGHPRPAAPPTGQPLSTGEAR
ncbi:hypothetical protein [uncultured Sphingomonas sp.]|uniref:hypothetical protein n=1 Tax=unclassified Sphingomonas TaxID=196159 RepID=UPI0025F2D1BC|nr:hypothetical protein [uncultured Sphingomonas sp.]